VARRSYARAQQLTEPFLVISGDALTDIDSGRHPLPSRAPRLPPSCSARAQPLDTGCRVDERPVQRFIEKPAGGVIATSPTRI